VRTVLQEGAVRLPDLPDVPTAREAGLDLKGFRERSWFGLLAPRGTPPEALDRISEEAAKAAVQPDLKEKLLGVAQVAQHQSPGDFGRQVSEDRVYFARLIRELDLKLE
jgi:tripartite-type tricarboxylate transporter receptor subunit TctC